MTLVELTDGGNGPPILFIPGSYSTPAAWRPIVDLLPDGIRCTSFSLCGYGKTPDTRRLEDCDMTHHMELVTQAARYIGGPLHVVGHSFGGTVAILAVQRGLLDAITLTTFEANLFSILRGTDQNDLYAQTLEMSTAFERAHFDGEEDAAGRIIDFWGGDGSFSAMPEPVQAYCRQTALANVFDWRGAHSIAESAHDFVGIEVPTRLVIGARANPVMRALTQKLGNAIPDAEQAIMPGASHFLISTHPQDCARHIKEMLSAVSVP